MNKKVLLTSLIALILVGISLILILPTLNNPETIPETSESESIASKAESETSVSASEIEITESQINTQKDIIYKNAIQHSHTAVLCEYMGEVESESKYRKFHNLEVLYGEAPDEYIYLSFYDNVVSKLVEGEKYILTLTRADMFFHFYPTYEIIANFPIKNISYPHSKFEFYCHDVVDCSPVDYYTTVTISGLKEAEELIAYIKELANERGFNRGETPYVPNVFRNESLETVTKNCDYILKIKVNSLNNYDLNGDDSTRAYTRSGCSVLQVIKGDSNVEQNIYFNAQKNVLEVGKEYIVMACPAILDTNSMGFMQCAENGIIPAEDTEKVDEIFSYLGIEPDLIPTHIGVREMQALENVKITYPDIEGDDALNRIYESFVKSSCAAVSVSYREVWDDNSPIAFFYIEDFYGDVPVKQEENLYLASDPNLKSTLKKDVQYLLILEETGETYLSKPLYKCTLAIPFDIFYEAGKFTFIHNATPPDSADITNYECTISFTEEYGDVLDIARVFRYLAIKYGYSK